MTLEEYKQILTDYNNRQYIDSRGTVWTNYGTYYIAGIICSNKFPEVQRPIFKKIPKNEAIINLRDYVARLYGVYHLDSPVNTPFTRAEILAGYYGVDYNQLLDRLPR